MNSSSYLNKHYIFRSVLIIIAIILLGSVMVYGLNTQYSRSAYFIFILLFFFFTKDNILGIALLFILVMNPLGLFYYKPYEWIFYITSSVGISYKSIFGVVVFLKYIIRISSARSSTIDYLKPGYKFFTFYLGFLLLWGLVFGHNAKSIYELLVTLPVFLIFYVVPRSFDNNRIVMFNKIILLFSLVHTIISIVDILSLRLITNLLIFGREVSTASIWDEGFIRLTGGIGIALYSMIIGLYYLVSKRQGLKVWYLWVVILTSWFYILNSATRGWMVASFFIMFAYFFVYFKKTFGSKIFSRVLIIILFLAVVIIQGSIRENLNVAFKRFATVESVSEGDMTAGGTAGRWQIRGPIVLTRFHESPVFGFGFSKVSTDYYDGHVGNHSLLIMGGIVGLAIVWLTVIFIIVFLYRLEKKGIHYSGVFVFGIALMAIMIIHSSSRAMISFRMPVDSAFLLCLFFNNVNALLNHSDQSKIS